MFSSGCQDVDVVLTTRELVRMAKSSGIDFDALPEEEADSVLGEYTGAGTLFGATGGVMEAAIRSAYFLVTKEELGNIEVKAVRGLKGVKEAEIDVKGTKVRVAVAHGIANVKSVLDRIREARDKGTEMPWHFIEVMACYGGCIAGGGQPYGVNDEVRRERTAGLYKDDILQPKRCSHHNTEVQLLYKDYLDKPGSKKAHELLHTHYTKRELYMK
jgi:NADH-quinone oxidoreductase subunit G